MEKHRLIDGQIYYPVGHDLVRNIRIIKQMAEYIYLVLSEYYTHDRTILICRGASGSIIAGIIAPMLFEMGIEDIQIYHIKKEGESTHSRGLPNGFKTAYLIVVDDFIITDATPEEIIEGFIKEKSEQIKEDVNKTIKELNEGGSPYYRYTMTYEEACELRDRVHGEYEEEI